MVLEINNLSVAIEGASDRLHAMEGLTLTVAPGETLCVVGESGSGKSVTAQAVMGLLPKGQLRLDGGSIRLEGDEVTTMTDAQLRRIRCRRAAMIFQEPMTALNPVETIGTQIGEVLEIHTDITRAARRARVNEMLDAVHLPDPAQIIDRYPHQLSGGQRQRAMIAMALILDPALLIADEPTTALDVTTQAQILRLIREMQARRNTGVLFITHDFGVVADIADRVVVMQHGKVVETGTGDQVLTAPQHPYTQALISAVPSMEVPPRPALATPKVLETVGLKKNFGRGAAAVAALKGIDLHIRRGETLGIVGESGSGKTTLARCVARIEDPGAGAILVEGRDIAALPERALKSHRRRVQMVFQDPYRSLNPRRSIGASITEGPVNFGMPKAQAMEKARELMGLVGLSPDALSRYPHQFSGGQRQRIAIARALAMEPSLLIGDEPVSALDVSIQAQVLDLLDDVKQRFDLACLFITHDLRVAARICDRIAVMHRGEVVETGPTAAIFANPTHDYTRTLLAAAPGAQTAKLEGAAE